MHTGALPHVGVGVVQLQVPDHMKPAHPNHCAIQQLQLGAKVDAILHPAAGDDVVKVQVQPKP